MFPQPRRSPRRSHSRFAALLTGAFSILCLLTLTSKPAAAQSLVFTFGGVFNSNNSYNAGSAFDGTNYTELPPVLDLAALEGGTFTATFTIPALVSPSLQSDTFAEYDFSPVSSIQFTLYDAAGSVMYQSSGPATDTFGDVLHAPSPYGEGTFDRVTVTSFDGFAVSGLTPPVALYSPQVNFFAASQLDFTNLSDSVNDTSHSYLSDLSFPIDAATYLRFPERTFLVDVGFGDDSGNGPFQLFETIASYNITSVRVASVVPEPGTLALFSIGGTLALLPCLRRRRLAC